MNKLYSLLALALVAACTLVSHALRAEETTSEKVQTGVDKTKKNLKKAGRKVKREVRDATGNHSTSKDLKEKVQDVGDDVETKAKELKRKVD